MANESDVTLKVKADTKDATKEISKFSKDTTDSLNNTAKQAQTGFSSLFSGASGGAVAFAGKLTVATAAAGLAAAAVFKIAESVQALAETADEVERINSQFTFLTQSAGDFGGTLRASLAATNQGINDFEDVMQAANAAIVNTSLSTDQIGKNFESSRRLSVALGVDSLQAFEAINTAIASGNTRVLKQIGLFVDSQAAIDGYAQSVGTSAKFLSEAQKQAALFEAIQLKINQNFGNVDTNTVRVSESFKQFGEAVKDVGEAASIGFTKIFGPAIQALLGKFTSELSGLANLVLAKYGGAVEQTTAKQDLLASSISNTEAELQKLQARQAFAAQFAQGEVSVIELQIGAQKKKLQSLRDELKLSQELQSENTRKLESSANVGRKEVVISAEQIRANQALLQSRTELIAKTTAAEATLVEEKLARATTDEAFEQTLAERDLIRDQELQVQKDAIDKQFKDARLSGTVAHAEAIRVAEEASEAKRTQSLVAREEKLKALRKAQRDKELADQDTFLSTAATLSNSKSKELAAIGKAAAITQIAIKTPPAVASSFAFGTSIGGPVLGFVFAGIAATAMAAQAAAIAGVPLATGLSEVPSGFPNDSFQARLTSGERVVNVKQNEDLTSFLDSQDRSSGSGEEVVGLLSRIAQRIEQLENTIVVNIGNKEIVREVREGLRSGRTLTA